MSIDNHKSTGVVDEIDLRELLSALWKGKVIIVGTTFVASIIAIAFAVSLPNIYRSEALLVPVSADGGGRLASKFGSLASLAGVSLAGGGEDKTLAGIEVVKSRLFFASFVTRPRVLKDLMAAKGWDPIHNKVIIDESIYDNSQNKWMREIDPPREAEPSVQEAYAEFSKLLTISQDKDSGFVTIAIEHYSPYVAKQWVDWLVEGINETIRQQEAAQAQRSIDYLTQQIESTQIAELQQGFFDLIQSQTETMMLANANPEYLFKTLDPAVVPELKAKPQRAVVCVLGALLGGMLGVIVALIRNLSGNSRPNSLDV
jgi:uncharacterized protein involved in exopolysaccharide biosynthesis